jgi:hypothetical protein
MQRRSPLGEWRDCINKDDVAEGGGRYHGRGFEGGQSGPSTWADAMADPRERKEQDHMGWWNDVASVTRVNTFAQGATAIFAAVAAVTGILAWVTSNHLERLKAEAAISRIDRLRTHRPTVMNKIAGIPKGPVHIESAVGDLEGTAIAIELRDILVAARWPVEPIGQSTQGGEFIGGIIVVYSPASAEVVSLARGLQDAGIAATTRRDAATSGAVIRVGKKL